MELTQTEVSVVEVMRETNTLNSKSPEPEGIHPSVLKELRLGSVKLLTVV